MSVLSDTRAGLCIRTEMTQLPRIRFFVRQFCMGRIFPVIGESAVRQLELAVHEVAANIIEHAYGGKEGRWIEIEIETAGDHILVDILHSGIPFVSGPLSMPPVVENKDRGFGLFFVQQSVDEILYYKDEKGRNGIRLLKKI